MWAVKMKALTEKGIQVGNNCSGSGAGCLADMVVPEEANKQGALKTSTCSISVFRWKYFWMCA